jgi:Transketolase
MALAPVAYCLWQQFLRFDPQDPVWPNRDRFVLSIGHASMLLYSLLHLTEVRAVSKDYETLGEVSVPLDAIKRFGNWIAAARDIRSTAGRRVWRPPQDRSAKASPPASA